MKVIVLSVVLILSSAFALVAQSEKLHSGDSNRVALEREIISKELIQLRDSIQLTLITFDIKIKDASKAKARKASTVRTSKLTKARHELAGYQDKVKLGLEEVYQTSQNGWSKAAIDRIRAVMADSRRNHYRISKLLKS